MRPTRSNRPWQGQLSWPGVAEQACVTRNLCQQAAAPRVAAALLAALLAAVLLAPVATGRAQGVAPTTPPPTAVETVAEPAAEAAPQGFLGILFSGGAVGIVIMLFLLALSFTAVYLVVENLMSLRRSELLPEGLSEAVRQQLQGGRLAEADRLCVEQPSLLAFVLHNGLSEADAGWSAVEKAMEDAAAEQSARLLRKIEYLSVIGNLAPMGGLLGTVTGMILCFQRVASSQGSAGAGELAEGIYQALVTTVVGLVVAIPALGAYAVFRNRVDQLVAEAAYAAQHALAPLKRARRRAHPTTAAAPPLPPA